MSGYWGWRPLVVGVFVSVIICIILPACTNLPSQPPTSTQPAPIITRPPRTLTPSPTPGIALVTTTPQPATSSTPNLPTISPTNLAHANIFSPLLTTCYMVNIDDMLCLGEIDNDSGATYEDIILHTTFYDAQGNTLFAQQTAVLQASLPPQQHAPFHLLLSGENGVDLRSLKSLNTEILSAQLSPPVDVPAIQVETLSAHLIAEVYTIRMALSNPSRRDAHHVEVIACIYDSIHRLVGYRILTLPVLLGGARYEGEILITPLVKDADLTFTLDVISR